MALATPYGFDTYEITSQLRDTQMQVAQLRAADAVERRKLSYV